MLFDASPANEERRPGAAKRRKRKTSEHVQKRNSFETWTRAELLLADWLLAWALARLRTAEHVDAYVEARKRVRRALDVKDSAIVARFLQLKPPLPHDEGARWPKLWELFRRALEREPL